MSLKQRWYVFDELAPSAKQWRNAEFPGWEIFEQPGGYYIWERFRFVGQRASWDAAVTLVEAAR